LKCERFPQRRHGNRLAGRAGEHGTDVPIRQSPRTSHLWPHAKRWQRKRQASYATSAKRL
jgi:hypothetical protein